MRKLPQDKLEEELFLRMLSDSRQGKGEMFDLQTLCVVMNIEASPEQLIAFAKENDPEYGRRDITMKRISFRISASGLRHAASLEKSRVGTSEETRINTPIHISNHFSPINHVSSKPKPKLSQISWSGWAGAIVAIIGILVALWIGGKI